MYNTEAVLKSSPLYTHSFHSAASMQEVYWTRLKVIVPHMEIMMPAKTRLCALWSQFGIFTRAFSQIIHLKGQPVMFYHTHASVLTYVIDELRENQYFVLIWS